MGKKIKYIIFGISKDYKEIIVLKKSESLSYDDFIADLPEAECRWAVYDFEYEKEEGGTRNKICFFAWYADCISCIYNLRHVLQGRPMMLK